jgi:anti-sigma factor RsiW
MDCKQCAENLTAYQDAELSATETEEVLQHLQTCTSCMEELSSLRMASDYIESHAKQLNPDPIAWRLIQARIADMRPSPSPLHHLFLRWRLAAIAGLTFALLSGFGYFQYRQHEQRNLDRYVSKYLQQRNARLSARIAGFSNAPAGVWEEKNPYENNPFIEVKSTPADNPFRLEDR